MEVLEGRQQFERSLAEELIFFFALVYRSAHVYFTVVRCGVVYDTFRVEWCKSKIVRYIELCCKAWVLPRDRIPNALCLR